MRGCADGRDSEQGTRHLGDAGTLGGGGRAELHRAFCCASPGEADLTRKRVTCCALHSGAESNCPQRLSPRLPLNHGAPGTVSGTLGRRQTVAGGPVGGADPHQPPGTSSGRRQPAHSSTLPPSSAWSSDEGHTGETTPHPGQQDGGAWRPRLASGARPSLPGATGVWAAGREAGAQPRTRTSHPGVIDAQSLVPVPNVRAHGLPVSQRFASSNPSASQPPQEVGPTWPSKERGPSSAVAWLL